MKNLRTFRLNNLMPISWQHVFGIPIRPHHHLMTLSVQLRTCLSHLIHPRTLICLILSLITFLSAAAPVPLVPDKPVFEIDLSRFDMALEKTLTPPLHSLTHKIRRGDNLDQLLQTQGLSAQNAYKAAKAFARFHKPTQIRVGEHINFHFTDNSLTHMTYKPSLHDTIFVQKKADNFMAYKISAEFQTGYLAIAGHIQNSLYMEAQNQNIPDKIIQKFASIYEYSIDFQRDIQPNDRFEMLFEVAHDHHGNIVEAGNLLFTSFSPQGKTHKYYLYKNARGQKNFFDSQGQAAKRKLRATPVHGARLSSRYGQRKHPILGYQKMHYGLDFAAPAGTPVLAAGDGRILRASRYGSYGKYIRIKHANGYETAYAHLQAYNKGIRKGAYIKQDQIIGYIGSTGRSTAPHLHYEVLYKGKKINPRRVAKLPGTPLQPAEIPAFNIWQTEIDQLHARTLNASTLYAHHP